MDWETVSKHDWTRGPVSAAWRSRLGRPTSRRIEWGYHPSTMTTLEMQRAAPMSGHATAAAALEPIAFEDGTYQPGACNIGPAEIARRRRAGHVGLAASVTLLGALVVLDTPPATRLLVALPAAVAASGY